MKEMKVGRKLGLIITLLLTLSLFLPIVATGTSAVADTPTPTPTPAPTVISVSPSSGLQGQSITAVVITGTNFTGASAVSFGAEITVNSFIFNSATQITANIKIDHYATPGSRDVSVTTPGGTGTRPGAFTVIQAPPVITRLSSNYGFRGQPPALVSIYGDYFEGVTAVSFGPGITIQNAGAWSQTWILTKILIPYDATPGKRDVSVTTPGGTATLTGGFTVSETAVSIKVNSPNAGENWEIGTRQTITWASSGLTGIYNKVSIQLSRDGGSTWNTIAVSTKNDGAESWKVTGPATNQARFKVFSTVYPDIFDTSDANFIISAPTIKVTFPNGGERWKIGTKQTLTWTTSPGFTGKVKIQLSIDGGATWKTIISSTKNDGFEAWKITGPPTDQARIKMLSVDNPDVFDICDANFIISAGIILTTSPDGGEIWQIGTKQTITWTSNDVTGKIRIQLSRDGGETWSTIISSTTNDGAESWKVNGPATNQARIRVLSKSYPTVFDISDANFTISR